MKRTVRTGERRVLNASIGGDIRKRIAKLAIDQDRSMWELVEQALAEYLDRNEKKAPARA